MLFNESEIFVFMEMKCSVHAIGTKDSIIDRMHSNSICFIHENVFAVMVF